MTAEYSLVPFKVEHYERVQAECGGPPLASPEDLRALEATLSYAILCRGEPLVVCGYVEQWAGRHVGWALMSPRTAGRMVGITRLARRITAAPRGRLEITVREDFALGHKWARMLGFEVEVELLREYGPEGEDHVGYVRFNR